MAFVPVPNTLQVDVLYLLAGQRVENTLYFERDGGWSLPQIIDWLEQMETLIKTDLLPALSASITLIELIGRVLDTASSIGFSQPVSSGNTGGVAGNASPNNVTYTISFKTGLTGRSFRGRNYVPGLPVAAVTGNVIGSTTRTAILAFYTALKAMADAATNPWVVVSRYSGVGMDGRPVPRMSGVTTPIESVTTFDTTVDSQRRRLPGRGT